MGQFNYLDTVDDSCPATNLVITPKKSSQNNSDYSNFWKEYKPQKNNVRDEGGVYKFYSQDSYAENNKISPASVQTVKSMIDTIREVFGLTVAQIAQLVGVSRPTLYNHISEKERPKSTADYVRFYELALDASKVASVDLKLGLKSVLVEGKTLLDYLKSSSLDKDVFLSVVQQVSESIEKRLSSVDDAISIEEQRDKTRSISKLG